MIAKYVAITSGLASAGLMFTDGMLDKGALTFLRHGDTQAILAFFLLLFLIAIIRMYNTIVGKLMDVIQQNTEGFRRLTDVVEELKRMVNK